MANPASVQIRIRTTAADTAAWVKWNVRKQIPFATSLALNWTVEDAQKAERKRLPVVFPGMRSKNPAKRLQFKKSNKKQYPNIQAILYHPDDYMAEHVTGKVRRARRKVITIPTRLVKRNASGKKRKSHTPAQLLDKRGFFQKDLLRKPKPRSGRLARIGGAPVWYLLRPSVRIEPRWDFYGGVRRTVAKTLRANMAKAMQVAVKSARGQPGHFTSSEGRFFFLKADRAVRG